MGWGCAAVAEPLCRADGDGHLATVPDLPGSMPGGETRGGAGRSVEGAVPDWIEDTVRDWIEDARELRRVVPGPARLIVAAGE